MKRTIFSTARLVSILLIMATLAPATAAKGGGSAYQTGFIRWRSADNGFTGWKLNGVHLNKASHELEFQQATASAGTDPYGPSGYNNGNYYNGGSFLVGEATSP